jgi:hypothetical protein
VFQLKYYNHPQVVFANKLLINVPASMACSSFVNLVFYVDLELLTLNQIDRDECGFDPVYWSRALP